MTSVACAIVSRILSEPEANTHYLTVNETKKRSSSIPMIDITSIMGLEDRKRRLSEDVVDMELQERERLKKLYRQIQRQVHCRQESKMNSERWRRERSRSRSRSVCSGLIREREEDRRKKDDKRSHSQSVLPPCSITEDEETEFVNNDMPSYSGTMLSQMLEEADKRKKLRRGERNRKRVKRCCHVEP